MHYRRIVGGIALSVLVLAMAGQAENKYIGVKKCGTCHKVPSLGGTAYLVWEKSAHAKAYQTLLGDAAKKIATEKGLKAAPSEAPECLKCHVTGGGKATNVEPTFSIKDGITCEACHGAASAYLTIHNKKGEENLAKAKAAGLILPAKDEKLCVQCHNSESPTAKPFKFAESWKLIEHTGPVKK